MGGILPAALTRPSQLTTPRRGQSLAGHLPSPRTPSPYDQGLPAAGGRGSDRMLRAGSSQHLGTELAELGRCSTETGHDESSCEDILAGERQSLLKAPLSLESLPCKEDITDRSGGPGRPPAGRLRQLQSLAYVGLYVAAGLAVGVTGPALPWITAQLPPGTNLATAFALRGLGGLLGSFGGAWAVHLRLPGNLVLACGGLLAAAGVASLQVAHSGAGVAACLFALDVGCGIGQVANTMMAWIQPERHLVAWLNILNGMFGVGTLLAPAAVALLATISGSHDVGVDRALMILPSMALLCCALLLLVPSPRQPSVSHDGKTSTEGWLKLAAAVLTAAAISGAVGTENTFALFLSSYIGYGRTTGGLSAGERQADMITSAFWAAFTAGRLGSGLLDSVFSRAPVLSLWAQIVFMSGGIAAVVLFPGHIAAYWAGAIMTGTGVAGLFAGLMGQLAQKVPIDSKVGGMVGVGAMSGIAMWQATAASLSPGWSMHVVGCAALATALAQIVLQVVLAKLPNTAETDD